MKVMTTGMRMLLLCGLLAVAISTGVPPEIMQWVALHGGDTLEPAQVLPVAAGIIWERSGQITQDMHIDTMGASLFLYVFQLL
jgi:hypothetical protein